MSCVLLKAHCTKLQLKVGCQQKPCPDLMKNPVFQLDARSGGELANALPFRHRLHEGRLQRQGQDRGRRRVGDRSRWRGRQEEEAALEEGQEARDQGGSAVR